MRGMGTAHRSTTTMIRVRRVTLSATRRDRRVMSSTGQGNPWMDMHTIMIITIIISDVFESLKSTDLNTCLVVIMIYI